MNSPTSIIITPGGAKNQRLREKQRMPTETVYPTGLNPRWVSDLINTRPTGGEDPEFKDINGDEEFLAYESTYDYKPGEYNKYDWGKPGKNWP